MVKVEPPGGDPARAELPLVDGESAFFAWLAAGKLSVTLSLDDPRVDELASHADIVVHSERGEAAGRLEERLAAANERAVVLSLSPYGRSGDRADWQATPFTEYATGGYHYFAGDRAREPLALPGHQVPFHAGTHGAVAVLAGLWRRPRAGQGAADRGLPPGGHPQRSRLAHHHLDAPGRGPEPYGQHLRALR